MASILTKLLFGFLLLLSVMIQAQIPDGSFAPNWTATDVHGETHTLSSILASGKSVGLKFSATWCGPCWNYHNTHSMKTTYETYGPNGTDEIEMFYLEASPSTNEACLFGPSGCFGGTQGDWVTGTPYPVVHLEGANQGLGNDYQILGYPTLYAVSPDQRVYWIGPHFQATPAVWESWLIQSFSLDANAVVTPAECGGDGAIDLNRSGGYLNVSYQWSNGATTEDLTGLDPGTYTVTMTDSHDYDVEKTYTIDGPPNGPLHVDLVYQEDVSCAGAQDGSIELEVFGIDGFGYTYAWSHGATDSYVSGLDGGVYSVTVTASNGCEVVEFYDIYEPPALEATTTTAPTTCEQINGQIDISAEGGTPPYAYALGNGATSNDGIFEALPGGMHQVIVTDALGCEESYQVVIDEIASPIVNAQSTQSLDCTTTMTTIVGAGSSVGPQYTYEWTTANGNIVSGGSEIDVVVDAPGTYTLQVTDTEHGCTSSAAATVAIDNELPTISVPSDTALTCELTSIELCASVEDSTTVIWQLPSGPVTGLCVVVDAQGVYTAEAVGANGCSVTSSVDVQLSAEQPQVTVAEPNVLTCSEPATVLQASVQGAADNYLFAWTTNDGNLVGVSDQASVTVDQPGNYTVLVTDVQSGCSTSQNVTVTSEAALPDPSFSFSLDDGILSLTNTSDEIEEVMWSYDSGQSASGNQVEITFAENGTYEICLTVYNACGPAEHCESIFYVVDLVAAPTATDVLCAGEENGTVMSNVSGGLPPYAVTWTHANGQVFSGTSVDDLAPGEYQMNIVDDFGYTESGSVVVGTPLPIEILDAEVVDESAVGANDGSISLTAAGGTGALTYLWNTGATTPSITNLEPGSYSCEIKDENDCEISSPEFEINAAPTNVNELEGLTHVKIYPVPVRDQMIVDFSFDQAVNGRLLVLDVQGKLVADRPVKGLDIKEQIDLSDGSAGLYFVQLVTADGIYVEKVLKL